MAFGKPKKPAAPVRPPTNEELILRHRAAAEDLLARSAKAGRIEAETRLATMATAHAVLCLSYVQHPIPAPAEAEPTGSEP